MKIFQTRKANRQNIETKSSDLYAKVLRDAGFQVTSGIASLPTAVIATYGTHSFYYQALFLFFVFFCVLNTVFSIYSYIIIDLTLIDN
ncbi:MAG: hypothetical protein ACFFAU_19265 [Candidatus Hodarchaeota archaeon]